MSLDDFKRSYPLRTVCEVTREIHDIIKENRDILGGLYDTIFLKLQEQMRMQKKMDSKLRSYKFGYEDDMFKANPNYKQLEKDRADHA